MCGKTGTHGEKVKRAKVSVTIYERSGNFFGIFLRFVGRLNPIVGVHCYKTKEEDKCFTV